MCEPALLLVFGLAAIVQAQIPQELLQDALRKLQEGDLEVAATEYRQFLTMYSEATAMP